MPKIASKANPPIIVHPPSESKLIINAITIPKKRERERENSSYLPCRCFRVICNPWFPSRKSAGVHTDVHTKERFLRTVLAQRPSYCEYYARKTSGPWAPCVLSPVCAYKRGFCRSVAGRVYRGNGLISPARVYIPPPTCTPRSAPLNKRRTFLANASILGEDEAKNLVCA